MKDVRPQSEADGCPCDVENSGASIPSAAEILVAVAVGRGVLVAVAVSAAEHWPQGSVGVEEEAGDGG